VIHLVDLGVIFKGHSSKALNAHYGLDTASTPPLSLSPTHYSPYLAVMSALEASSVPGCLAAADPIKAIRKAIITDLGIDPSLVTDSDCIAVARVSEIVGTRGCRLSACALAAVTRQTGMDKGSELVRFGLDGSLVEFYPRFEERIRDALRELMGEEVEKRCEIGLAKDGSGVGGTSLFLSLLSRLGVY
jgi:hexokinase